MAKGFIILKDRSCYSSRWTGYDLIITLVIKELESDDKGEGLRKLLEKKIPTNKHTDEIEMGWGFINKVSQTIERTLDLRGLSDNHHELFWVALQKVCDKLMTLGEDYSNINPSIPRELLRRKKLSEKGENPLGHSNWDVLADEEFEKLS